MFQQKNTPCSPARSNKTDNLTSSGVVTKSGTFIPPDQTPKAVGQVPVVAPALVHAKYTNKNLQKNTKL